MNQVKFCLLNFYLDNFKQTEFSNLNLLKIQSKVNQDEYYEYISKLFQSKTKPLDFIHDLPRAPDLIWKSFILQNLFTNSFTKLLEESRSKITHLLFKKLACPSFNTSQSDINFLGRSLYQNKNNHMKEKIVESNSFENIWDKSEAKSLLVSNEISSKLDSNKYLNCRENNGSFSIQSQCFDKKVSTTNNE